MRFTAWGFGWFGALAVSLVLPAGTWAASLEQSLVFTQVRDGRSRLVRVESDGGLHLLSERFHSARDPDVSFDGRRILFAAKVDAASRWQIFEMGWDGSSIRQITREEMDCRNPVYQSKLYQITSDEPWYQIAFVGTAPERRPSLYSARPDGTAVRRITYNPFDDAAPYLMPDGRMLFASRQAHRWSPGEQDRMPLFGINIDGTDYAAFSGEQGSPWKAMPTVTANRLVVFVESDRPIDEAGGWLSAVTLRRNLHSYRQLTTPQEGRFHSPSPLPDGSVLVSFRPAESATFGIWRFNPESRARELLFDDPAWDDLQAKILAPRPEPDGRSSVVNEEDPTGILYGLNVYVSDLPRSEWLPEGGAKRLRVLEGVPRNSAGSSVTVEPPSTRVLGEVDVEADGSFNVRVPANTPIQLQLLDEEGMALRACRWIWVRNREPRGCIGCHEDGELSPENRLVHAVTREAMDLTLPPERRRTVTYRRDVAPLVARGCASGACHGGGIEPPLATADDVRRLVRGSARTSPLIWSLYGRSTARPWDDVADGGAAQRMPPHEAVPLSNEEKRTIIEWVDMGAQIQ